MGENVGAKKANQGNEMAQDVLSLFMSLLCLLVPFIGMKHHSQKSEKRLEFRSMWPFCRERKKKRGKMDKLIAGVIIGGAIGSIIGKKLLEKREERDDAEEEKGE